MSFIPRDLSLMATGNGTNWWSYKTNDTADQCDNSGYFNAASGDLRVFDLIFAVVDMDGTPAVVSLFVVSNAGGVVDCANTVSLGTSGTDTD